MALAGCRMSNFKTARTRRITNGDLRVRAVTLAVGAFMGYRQLELFLCREGECRLLLIPRIPRVDASTVYLQMEDAVWILSPGGHCLTDAYAVQMRRLALVVLGDGIQPPRVRWVLGSFGSWAYQE